MNSTLNPTPIYNHKFVALIVFGILSLAMETASAQTVLYRQVFGRTSVEGSSTLSPVNWAAYAGNNSNLQTGSGYNSTLRGDASATGTTTLGNVNSSVVASSMTEGIGFFYIRSSDAGNAGDLYIPNATEQAAFGAIDYGDYSSLDLSVYAKNNVRTFRFVVEIGGTAFGNGTWLASDEYTVTNSWAQYNLAYTEDTNDRYSLSFVPDSGNDITISASTLAGDTLSFPTGDITNFGILISSPGTTAMQFDAFEVSGVAVPEPGYYASFLGAGILGLVTLRRRKIA